MDRLEIIKKIIEELKVYKKYLINLKSYYGIFGKYKEENNDNNKSLIDK